MEYDFLVLGSGIAGLTFAINAAPYGSVAILTKKQRSESNTNYAQGGIAAAIGADDSWELHLQDTLNAGAGLCDREAVEVLVKNGPRMVQWLMELGAQFDKNPDGSIALGREGGHSRNRILHAADHTGYEIERTLLIAARKTPHITLLEHYQALDLILERGVCAGVQVLDTLTGDRFEIRAKATLLATGGCGQVYLHTSNPPIATGDGIAMAWRVGATIGNMEFIQFHPTTLYHTDAPSFLISEAVRGEGGILRRRDGYRFMPDYDPRAELAPRDIVARAIDAELKKTGDPCVFLDITHLDPEFIKRRFPTIYHTCLQYGVDITQEPIPVVPAAHYTCGGVWTDLDGRTTIPRLYACGEVAYTGVHGANRLASNSLLEALVFAERAALHAATRLDELPPKPKPSCITIQRSPIKPTAPAKNHAYNWDADRLRIRQIMQKKVGIVRTVARLQEARCELETLAAQMETAYRDLPPTVESCEARNLAACAVLIAHSALARKESRGLHYVLDYPETRAEFAACPTLITPS
ncbi:MAG: L-aspartate oxidase [Armatimonadetes bacterium JP3_11]|jgi:L-aspartate oxidase|nr:MAG: L-aspartate oxidase [Armatimonadetes bacterium CP1_7O]OYT75510.1 MAG: L-aspartate oxidase [Armatimonadetes bacterium JP3_11]RMH07878.1 MAG: L-aspartate oxidase [Armatimonadota bacterium]